MIASSESFEKTIGKLSKILDDLPKQIERLNKQVQLCDLEEQDVLHVLEFSSFNAQQGWKLAKDLQLTRKKRRELKDELDELLKIQTAVGNNRAMTSHVRSAKDILSYSKKLKKTRNYTLRVRKDLVNKKIRVIG